jgi:hypothetical protein
MKEAALQKQLKLFVALVTCAVLIGVGVVGASASNGDGKNNAHPATILSSVRTHALNLADRIGVGEDEGQVAPGTLDDRKDLLPQAQITIDDAIAAAQAVYQGTLAEIDLEHYKGHLVFNVDSGGKDIKVDASNGTVLGAESDD